MCDYYDKLCFVTCAYNRDWSDFGIFSLNVPNCSQRFKFACSTLC